MRIIHSGGFPDDERRQNRAVIYSNIIIAFKILLDIMETEDIAFENGETKVWIFRRSQTSWLYSQISGKQLLIIFYRPWAKSSKRQKLMLMLMLPSQTPKWKMLWQECGLIPACSKLLHEDTNLLFTTIWTSMLLESIDPCTAIIANFIAVSSNLLTAFSLLIGCLITKICCILDCGPLELRKPFLNWARWISAWWMLEDSDQRERSGSIASRVYSVFSSWLLFQDTISALLRTRLL